MAVYCIVPSSSRACFTLRHARTQKEPSAPLSKAGCRAPSGCLNRGGRRYRHPRHTRARGASHRGAGLLSGREELVSARRQRTRVFGSSPAASNTAARLTVFAVPADAPRHCLDPFCQRWRGLLLFQPAMYARPSGRSRQAVVGPGPTSLKQIHDRLTAAHNSGPRSLNGVARARSSPHWIAPQSRGFGKHIGQFPAGAHRLSPCSLQGRLAWSAVMEARRRDRPRIHRRAEAQWRSASSKAANRAHRCGMERMAAAGFARCSK